MTPTTEERADARRRALQLVADCNAAEIEYGPALLREVSLPTFSERAFRTWLGAKAAVKDKFGSRRESESGDGFHPDAPRPGERGFRGPYGS